MINYFCNACEWTWNFVFLHLLNNMVKLYRTTHKWCVFSIIPLLHTLSEALHNSYTLVKWKKVTCDVTYLQNHSVIFKSSIIYQINLINIYASRTSVNFIFTDLFQDGLRHTFYLQRFTHIAMGIFRYVTYEILNKIMKNRKVRNRHCGLVPIFQILQTWRSPLQYG